MDWQLALLLIVGSFIVLLVLGLPVAFSFMIVNLIGAYLFWGGELGLHQIVNSLADSVTVWTLLPVVTFILMGEVMFHSGLTPHIFNAIDNWLGRLPGRLSFLAVSFGTMFAVLSGNSMASTAIMGATLVPEMESRGYKKPMTLGPILGSGGLAIMIPPSALAIVLAYLGEISTGKLLMAIIIPGLLMAFLYATYIIVRCLLQPSIAPSYQVPNVSLLNKIGNTAGYILPLSFILFLVIGLIFLGVATPTEAAALGCLGSFVLVAAYRKLNRKTVTTSIGSAIRHIIMILMIIVGAKAFSQILAFSGASRGLIDLFLNMPLAPIFIVMSMQVVLIILGCFMGPVEMLLLTLPIFMPTIKTMGFSEVWFGAIVLLNCEMAITTPPFGMSLFILKKVAPSDTTMGDIYRAAIPFLLCDLIAMILIVLFPPISLWLPELMR
ncbi:TRAP transporter large permease subunit [Chloroflexota bacterium]